MAASPALLHSVMHLVVRPSLIPRALLVGILVTAGVASAADQSARKAVVPTRSLILTPEQLHACLKQRDDLRVQTDAAGKDKTALAAEGDEIASAGNVLADEAAALDKTNAELVEAYNAKVVARDKRIEAYQAKVGAYNGRAEAANASKDAYARACENRRYDEGDLAEPKRKK
ncbi:MAG: hypothetical protein M3Z29_06370 [Pseudomonadota bacterium]|nr:hypothetical protein [Pseudomonadota bacterium]